MATMRTGPGAMIFDATKIARAVTYGGPRDDFFRIIDVFEVNGLHVKINRTVLKKQAFPITFTFSK